MEKEIINLEYTPKKGLIDCLCEGVGSFFQNFAPFLKMLLPILWTLLATCLLTLAVISVSFCVLTNNPILICLSLAFVIFSIFVFCYAFWRYLLGIIAVSYLAKDIFENRELQEPKQYYSYVEQHSKSYINYWLIYALIGIIWISIFTALCVSVCISVIDANIRIILGAILIGFILASVPFTLGLSISKFFWAYGNKLTPGASIFNAIKISYKKFLEIFAFMLLLNVFICAIEGILTLVLAPLSLAFAFVASYFISFVTTRYYFEVKKD